MFNKMDELVNDFFTASDDLIKKYKKDSNINKNEKESDSFVVEESTDWKVEGKDEV